MINRLFILLLVIPFVAGCASTRITGYTDPAFSTTTYRNTTVFASGFGLQRGAALETSICDEFRSRNIGCTNFTSIFPPTQRYSGTDISNVLKNKNIQSIIVVSAGGDKSASNILGFQSYGTATAYGNSAYGNTSTYALRSYARHSRVHVRLLDVESRQTAWIGDANTEAKGLLNVTDSVFNSSLASEIVDTLSGIGKF